MCAISDDRLKPSGIVATSNGYVVVNGQTTVASHKKIFFLDNKCKVTSKSVALADQRDPQDVTLTPDGTIWVADIGDNPLESERRETIALWKLAEDSTKPVVYRMSYPDGPHNAGALLLASDGTPVIVTKEPGKTALYTPTAALVAEETIPLQKVGSFTPPKTTTENLFGDSPGRTTVTGGATSPDGSRVVLRTFADAFEFDVADGNVVEAITKGTPRATALPQEPAGEAITYSADGKSFLTVSKVAKAEIRRYTPSTATAKADKNDDAAGGSDGQSWYEKLTLDDITYLVGAVGLLGGLLVGAGVLGIVLARRRKPEEDPDPASDGAVPPKDPLPASARQVAPISPVPSGTYRSSATVPAGTARPAIAARPAAESRAAIAARPAHDSQGFQATGPAGKGGGVYGAPARRAGSSGSGTVYGGAASAAAPPPAAPPAPPAGPAGAPPRRPPRPPRPPRPAVDPRGRPAAEPSGPGGGVYQSGTPRQYDSNQDPYDYADQDPRY